MSIPAVGTSHSPVTEISAEEDNDDTVSSSNDTDVSATVSSSESDVEESAASENNDKTSADVSKNKTFKPGIQQLDLLRTQRFIGVSKSKAFEELSLVDIISKVIDTYNKIQNQELEQTKQKGKGHRSKKISKPKKKKPAAIAQWEKIKDSTGKEIAEDPIPPYDVVTYNRVATGTPTSTKLIRQKGAQTFPNQTTNAIFFFFKEWQETISTKEKEEKSGEIKKKEEVLKKREIIALTIGSGYRVLRPCIDYNYPHAIAKRIANLETIKKITRLSVVGKDAASETLTFPGNHILCSISSLYYVVESFVCVVKIASEFHRIVAKLGKQEKKKKETATTDSKSHTAVAKLGKQKKSKKDSEKKDKAVRIEVLTGLLHLDKTIALEEYAKVLPLLSTYAQGDSSREAKNTNDQNLDFLSLMVPIEARGSKKYDKKSDESLDSTIIEFRSLNRKLLGRIYAAYMRGVPLEAHFRHKHLTDFLRSEEYQTTINGKVESWMDIPSLEDIVRKVLSSQEPKNDKDTFCTTFTGSTITYGSNPQPIALTDCLEGEVKIGKGTARRSYFKVRGMWYQLNADFHTLLDQDFRNLLQKVLIAPNSKWRLDKPWRWTASKKKNLSVNIVSEAVLKDVLGDLTAVKAVKGKHPQKHRTLFTELQKTKVSYICADTEDGKTKEGRVYTNLFYRVVETKLTGDILSIKEIADQKDAIEAKLQEWKNKNTKVTVTETDWKVFGKDAEKIKQALLENRSLLEQKNKQNDSSSTKTDNPESQEVEIVIEDEVKSASTQNSEKSDLSQTDSEPKKKSKATAEYFVQNPLFTKLFQKFASAEFQNKKAKLSDEQLKKLQQLLESSYKARDIEADQEIKGENEAAYNRKYLYEEYRAENKAVWEKEVKDKGWLVLDCVTPSGIELCDIVKYTKNAAYLYQVKDKFGQHTRDACSQILNAATVLRSALSMPQNNYLCRLWKAISKQEGECKTEADKTFRGALQAHSTAIGEEAFLKIFKKRKIVFVYACLNSKKLFNEKNISTQFLPEHLVDESLKGKEVAIIEALKKQCFLDIHGRITTLALKSTQKGFKLEGYSDKESQAIIQCLAAKSSKLKSTLAKLELLRLNHELTRLGFDLKICEIPWDKGYRISESGQSQSQSQTEEIDEEGEVDDFSDSDDEDDKNIISPKAKAGAIQAKANTKADAAKAKAENDAKTKAAIDKVAKQIADVDGRVAKFRADADKAAKELKDVCDAVVKSNSIDQFKGLIQVRNKKFFQALKYANDWRKAQKDFKFVTSLKKQREFTSLATSDQTALEASQAKIDFGPLYRNGLGLAASDKVIGEWQLKVETALKAQKEEAEILSYLETVDSSLITLPAIAAKHQQIVKAMLESFKKKGVRVPLPNQGNTCWMNSILQALAVFESEILSGVPEKADSKVGKFLDYDFESRQLMLIALRQYIVARYKDAPAIKVALENLLELIKTIPGIPMEIQATVGVKDQEDVKALLHPAILAMGRSFNLHNKGAGGTQTATTLKIDPPDLKALDFNALLEYACCGDDEKSSITSKASVGDEAPESLVVEINRLTDTADTRIKKQSQKINRLIEALKKHAKELSDESQVDLTSDDIEAMARKAIGNQTGLSRTGKNDAEILVEDVVDLKEIIGKDIAGARSAKAINYKLMAFTCHEGTASGGHYITYLFRDNKWIYCSDKDVKDADEKERKAALKQCNVLYLKRMNS